MKPTNLRVLFSSLAGHPDDCWNWPMCILSNGYGQSSGFLDGIHRRGPSHRIAYMIWKGPIPLGLTIDHLCRNRACFNPSHLEAVTNRVNILRGDTLAAKNAVKTHCIRGHPFNAENTRFDILKGRPTPRRRCLICHNQQTAIASKKWYAKKRAQ